MSLALSPSTFPAACETVVLLHASASSSRQWEQLAQALQPTHDVVAIDLHGHGRREAWAGSRPLSLHDDAELALEALESAGGGHLIGHSYGGAVALYLAARYPSMVYSLSVYEPVVFRLLADRASASPAANEPFAIASQMRGLVADGLVMEAGERFVDYWSGAGAWQRMSPDRQRSLAQRMTTVVAHFDTLMNEPLDASSLRRLAMPTLVLHGTRTTPAARLLAELLGELLPQATHEPMHGLGHMGPLTDAPRVNERLLRFARRASSAGIPCLY
jgi:pimeloyl-ACP methyl ester carboxylesterase